MSGHPPAIAAVVPDRVAEIEQKLGVVPARDGTTAEFARLLGRADATLETSRIGPPVDDAPTTFAAPAGAAAVTGSNPGDAVVALAARQIGVPYVWGGEDPTTGFDCSGLVQHTFAELGVEMPRVSQDQARMGAEIADIERARPGDLLAFGDPATHIAIYVGDGRMLHAPRTGEAVKVEPIDRPISSIRRIVTATTPTTTTTTTTAPATASTPAAGPVSLGPVPYADLFEASGARYGVDPALLASVAAVESAFDPDAVSHAGAIGLMQFMPGTAAAYGIDPTDPAQAVDGAARYLRGALERFGSIELALAAYNAGPGAVSRYGGIPPYPETQAYVRKVLGRYEAHR